MKTKIHQYLWTALEYVNTVIYLGASLTYDGASDNSLRIRIAISMSAMVKLENI